MSITHCKQFIKTVLSIIYNGIKIIRFAKISYPFFIGRGLVVHRPGNISIGKNVTIGRFSRLSCYGKNKSDEIIILDNVYIGSHFSALSGGILKIGSNTLIASYVAIISENHGMNPNCGIPYGKQSLVESPTEIGEYCWIGEKVIILPGVKIGNWSIIGAGSVVTSDIPPYSIAAGNPAKILKKYNQQNHYWEKL